MRLAVKLGFLALVLAPVTALGDNAPQVVLATPGAENGAIKRFTIRFSQPMVALGDPRAAAPYDRECAVAGEGRWADQQTYVEEFATGLPGGTRCTFTLKADLRSVAGYAAATTGQAYTIDGGGPVARAVLPAAQGDEIEEDQVFLVAANLAPDPASVASQAYCAVDGVGERIPVDVLPDGTAGELIARTVQGGYQTASFLSEAGLPATVPAAAADRRRAYPSVTALRCRRPLPPGRDMALVWGAGITAPGGHTAGTDQRFDYTVRQPFAARFECPRVNPRAGCNPIQKAYVRFTAPVAMSVAQQIRIQLPDGHQIAPTFSTEEQHAATISDISFAAPFQPNTAARLLLPGGVHDESGRTLSNAERFPLDIRFDAAPPLVKFAAPFGILESTQGGVLPVTVRNVEPQLQGQSLPIGGQALRVEGSDGEIARWTRTVNTAGDDQSHDGPPAANGDATRINDTGATSILPPGTAATRLSVALPGRGRDMEVVGIPLARPGFYVVELASPILGAALLGRNAPRYVSTAALVTNMAVHFQWGRERSLVWVTQLDSGQPAPQAAVRVTDACTGRLLARGTTDAQGGLMVPAGLPAPESGGSCDTDGTTHPLMVSATKADDYSFTLSDWGEGIQPYDFNLPYGYEAPADILHTVFDRTLVRQGETIHMRHYLRTQTAAGFGFSAGLTGTLVLSHSGDDTQFEIPLTIGADGTAETSWTAPQGAPMGDYQLQVKVGDQTIYTNQSFRVDEYRLPTMRATVTGPRDAQVRPARVPLDLFAGYLSGGGAPNLPVTIRVGYFPRSDTPDGYDGYTFGGQVLTEGVRAMNGNDDDEEGNGDAGSNLPPTQTLPASLGAQGTAQTVVNVPTGLTGTTDMQVEMDYQDANGQTLTAARRIPLWASAVQLGVRTDGWLMRQDDLRLRFVALDTDGHPIANQRISVALYSRETLTARRRLIGGFYAYDNQQRTTKLSPTCTATTDAQGLAECAVDPGVSGEVYAVATTTDAQGNEARAVTSAWLAGDDQWWFGGDNGDRMDIVPERTDYNAGDTARFQVRMPFREATALVTVEREGVISSFVTHLDGHDPVVEVPMTGAYAPDVYVSVMAVRGRVEPGWRHWLHGWAVTLGLSRASPSEGDEPTALVDLSKPSYRLGIARVRVGWDAHRLNVAVRSDATRYPARGIAQVDLQVTRPGGAPAASADVAFMAVDQALLQLSPNDSVNLIDAMMGDRPLSVRNATAQMQVVGKRHYGRKAVEAGGGGGGGDLSGLNRENFQPVLLWRGRVQLDAQGRARVPVQLGDSLSAFKLVAVATEGSALFGTGMAEVRTAQDLSIFAGLPPLVRNGDQYGATFTLRNGTAQPMTVTATAALSPAVAQGRAMTVTIPAGGAVPVTWNLTAPAGSGNLSWHVTARSSDGRSTDQVTVAQQVIEAVPVETWAATLARVGTDTSIPIALPAGAIANRGFVDIRLDDTLAPPMAGVQAYMRAYPYDCFEQRLSRAIALGDTGAWARLAAELPTYQAPDGLLRYWPTNTGDGSEALTAYVLSITSEAGLPIPDAQRTRMIEGLKAVLDGRVRHEDYGDVRLQRLAAFTALARAGAATPAMLGQLGIAPQEMPTSSLADYIVAVGRVPGVVNANAIRTAAEQVLRTRLVYEGTRLDLSDDAAAPWWLMSSGDEGAIKAMLATLGRPGWVDDAGRMMLGLALRQRQGHWDTTPANAWGAIAARRFAQLYPAAAITGPTRVSFGSVSAVRGWPLVEQQRSLSFPIPLTPVSTPLRLSQASGAGPWATVSVRAAVPLRSAVTAGYRLSRQVSVVSARTPGRLTAGDVVRVTLTIDAGADRNWVVVSDPIPAGATILGGDANQSTILVQSTDDTTTPSYVERGNDGWRGYFAWMPQGHYTVSYTLRLNGAGRFGLPPSRVEAMYSPAIHAAVPNAPVVVAAR